MPSKSSPKSKSNPEFQCDFCKDVFVSETRFYNHLCEKKRRFQQRDDKSVKLAFLCFQQFCKRKANKTIATIDKFESSRYYPNFVRFASHLNKNNALNPIGFLDFLLTINVGITKWCDDVYYERYIKELTKTEDPLTALERNIKLMQKWSVENEQHWTDFFRMVAPPEAVMWIKSGRLSPWLLFTIPESSELLLSRMTTEQLDIINNSIDPKYWQIKLSRNTEQVEHMRNILSEAGL